MKLIYRIFDNAGRKIKTLLRVVYMIEAICILLAAVGVLGYGVYSAIEWEEIEVLILCVLGAPIGAFLSLFMLWLLMLPSYALAELVCSTTESRNELLTIKEKLSATPVAPPSPVTPTAPVVVAEQTVEEVTE